MVELERITATKAEMMESNKIDIDLLSRYLRYSHINYINHRRKLDEKHRRIGKELDSSIQARRDAIKYHLSQHNNESNFDWTTRVGATLWELYGNDKLNLIKHGKYEFTDKELQYIVGYIKQ